MALDYKDCYEMNATSKYIKLKVQPCFMFNFYLISSSQFLLNVWQPHLQSQRRIKQIFTVREQRRDSTSSWEIFSTNITTNTGMSSFLLDGRTKESALKKFKENSISWSYLHSQELWYISKSKEPIQPKPLRLPPHNYKKDFWCSQKSFHILQRRDGSMSKPSILKRSWIQEKCVKTAKSLCSHQIQILKHFLTFI